MQLARFARDAVARALDVFRVVALTGPRQSGKTTLVRELSDHGGRSFVSLDDLTALDSALRDPRSFVDGLSVPATIDEIQRAPDLLLEIKRRVDRDRRRGAFLLTGSSDPLTAGKLRDSLAGRMALLSLRPLAFAEQAGQPLRSPLDRLDELASVEELASHLGGSSHEPLDIASLVLAGGYPEAVLDISPASRPLWFEHYTRTYLERDVPNLVRTDDPANFLRFVRLIAANTAQVVNQSRLASDLGVTSDTVRRWLGVLERSYVAQPLLPFWRNVRKRLTKAPKVHFIDSGLAAHLAGIRSWPQAVEQNAAGHLLETWVHHQLQVYISASPTPPQLHFFRSARGEECDFVVDGSWPLPIEVKSSRTLRAHDAAGVVAFLSTFRSARFGLVLYPGEELVPLAERVAAVPMRSFFDPRRR